jgi:hypothetical protein
VDHDKQPERRTQAEEDEPLLLVEAPGVLMKQRLLVVERTK